MRDIARRLERLEEALGARDCICADPKAAVAIAVIEDGWDEGRIRAAEEAQAGVCTVHRRLARPVLRLSRSDVHG